MKTKFKVGDLIRFPHDDYYWKNTLFVVLEVDNLEMTICVIYDDSKGKSNYFHYFYHEPLSQYVLFE